MWPPVRAAIELPELEKFKGYLWSDGEEGQVSVRMEN
jgi:hypothetical protein